MFYIKKIICFELYCWIKANNFIIGELEAEDPEIVCNARHKMTALSSCFAQLTHKAQTIFQNSAKVEVSHFKD